MVDIEGYLELLRDGRWIFGGKMVANPEKQYDPEAPELRPEAFFESDQKALAAILTGSGNRSSTDYTPVVPRRGFPEDLSPELQTWRSIYMGNPVANWFTGQELAEFDMKGRTMRQSGMANDPRVVAYILSGRRRGLLVGGWLADLRISIAGWMPFGGTVEWIESYAETVAEFYQDVPQRLAAAGPPNEVRLVVTASW